VIWNETLDNKRNNMKKQCHIQKANIQPNKWTQNEDNQISQSNLTQETRKIMRITLN
jgi:hypothetical protein